MGMSKVLSAEVEDSDQIALPEAAREAKSFDDEVFAEQIELTDRNISFGATAGMLGLPLAGYALFRFDWPPLFWVWSACVCVASIAVLAVSSRYRRVRPTGHSVRRWAPVYIAVSALLGLAWGAVAPLFFVVDPERIAVLMLILMVHLVSVSAAAAALPSSGYAFNLPVVALFVFACANTTSVLAHTAGATAVIMLLTFSAYSSKTNRVVVNSIRMRFENRELNDALTEQRVLERTRALEAVSRHKSEFLANMSHELRTPLNAILGYSEMLQEDAVEIGARSLIPDLVRINGAGKNLLELINSVLDLSKIEAGKMELNLEDLRPAELLSEIGEIVAPLARRNGNRFTMSCDPDIGLVRADRAKLRQVLLNLLSNAFKFTDHGAVSIRASRVEVDTRASIAFSVTDTGIGLSPVEIARLFEDFAQADSSTASKYGGTGIGLALSRRLCRLMGGDIEVQGIEGKGSTFTAFLPVSESAGDDGIGLTTQTALASQDKGIGTVLVIDDEPAVRDLLQRFLGKEGFHVLTADNGHDGVELARKVRPDVITLDVLMPEMDGWSVLGALAADPALREIPVIMLTIVDEKKTGYALGASEYLNKPIDRVRLSAVLRRFRRDLPILVVDDDPVMRLLLREILELDGRLVVEASDGVEALKQVAAKVPAAILLDLLMPRMNGFEMLETLRANPLWQDIPVCIVTAETLTAQEHAQLNGCVSHILEKGGAGHELLLGDVRRWVATSVGSRRHSVVPETPQTLPS